MTKESGSLTLTCGGHVTEAAAWLVVELMVPSDQEHTLLPVQKMSICEIHINVCVADLVRCGVEAQMHWGRC